MENERCARAVSPNPAARRTGAERRQPWATRKRQGQRGARLPVWLRGLPRSLSPSLPRSHPPAGARAPAPPPLPSAPPPHFGEQETRGPAEGRQVGEALLGEGAAPGGPSGVHLTAAAGAGDALWARTAPRN